MGPGLLDFNASGIEYFRGSLPGVQSGAINFYGSGIEQHRIASTFIGWARNYVMPGTAERFNSNNRSNICGLRRQNTWNRGAVQTQ